VYKYDLYHFYFSLPTGLMALYVHWVLKKPYVIALRGSDVPGYDESAWFMAPLHRLLRPLTRYLWRHASAVTVLSNSLMQLARQTLPDIDYKLIPNGIDGTRFPQKVGSQNFAKIRLITVCRMVTRKGLEHLIQAMRELQNSEIDLWLLGGGREQEQIAKLVQEFGLEECVWMPGYIRRDALTNYYLQADIFVLPSLSESFGQVLLEAMSTGLPIVATTVGGIPEIVHPDRGGVLIPPGDSGAIVEAVRSLVASPEQMAQMGRYNAAYVREKYQWSFVASAYHALYRDALRAHPAAVQSLDDTGRIRRINLP
jgi:glycosyltransferase involved in cell wall biosynthesis